jgi:ubiquinone/menaquinone biosynthesis C-methylase UbiE
VKRTSTSTVSFDGQAADFDLRAGLPPGVAPRIAAALAELAPAGSGVILDVGAGTGQIGEHLSRLCGARRQSRYLGMDVSGPMLAVFRRKLGASGALVRADASAPPWPIASGRVKLVFLSRAAHLLPPAVLVEEALRVASPEGALAVLGSVKSEPESLRAVVRREMRRLLAEQGVEARRAGDSQHRIAEALEERGGEVLPVVTAASWAVVHRAGDSLAAWRAKSGLGGRAVTAEIQDRVLARLEDWIRERYGSLDVGRDATDRYELAAIRLPGINERNLGGRV